MTPPGRVEIEAIYREHGHVVLRRAGRILGNDTDAREVLQEIFLSLLDRPDQFDRRSAVTTFLYAMTTNACLNRLRNQRRRAGLLAREARPQEEAAAGEGGATLDAARLLADLPERLAQVAVHYFIDEMTHDEIAEVLGVSRRQVGNLVARVQEEARKREKAA
jgi:RNA polymerase sigma factor (sigma-70 family)